MLLLLACAAAPDADGTHSRLAPEILTLQVHDAETLDPIAGANAALWGDDPDGVLTLLDAGDSDEDGAVWLTAAEADALWVSVDHVDYALTRLAVDEGWSDVVALPLTPTE